MISFHDKNIRVIIEIAICIVPNEKDRNESQQTSVVRKKERKKPILVGRRSSIYQKETPNMHLLYQQASPPTIIQKCFFHL
jgi:hypothetical protein